MGNNTCPLWQVDDFSSCARHRILESQSPFALIIISIAFAIYSSLSNIKSNQPAIRLPVDDEQTESTPSIGDCQNYGSSQISNLSESENIVDKHFNMKYISMNNEGSPKISIVTKFRSNYDRTLLLLQEFFLFIQLAISITPLIIPKLAKEWNSSPSTPYFNISFWGYIFLLTSIRVYYSSTGVPYKLPNIWYHTFNLIFISLFNTFFLFRSAMLHHTTNNASKFYIAQFIINALLFFLQGLDRFSDRPVTVLLTEGLEPSPEPESCFFQIISYSWLNPMIEKAQRVSPTLSDIWSLKLEDNAYPSLIRFHSLKAFNSFSFNLFYQFRKLFFYQSVATSIEAVLTFFPSMLLKKILEYVESPDTESASFAWLLVILMTFSSPIQAGLAGRGLFLGRRICTRMRAILIGEVYAKALRRQGTISTKKEEEEKEGESAGQTTDPNSATTLVDTAVKKKENEDKDNDDDDNTPRDLGSIINLIAVDSFKVSEICGYLHYFVNSFVMTIIAITVLYSLLGWAALVGAATIIIVSPLNYKLSMILGEYQKKMLKVTDKRIQKLNEAFQNIRIIKYFAWESKFADQILAVREEELQILLKRCTVWIIASFVWFITPTVVCLVAFYCYTIVGGHKLTTPIAFTSLSLFNLLRTPLDQFADMLSFVIQSKVSLDRIATFLQEDETTKYEQLNVVRDENSPEVGFQNATFAWSKTNNNDFKLRDIDIAFRKNKLNVVIGPTGSGKTSLLLALLGEMNLISGKVFLPGLQPRDDLVVDSKTGLTESVAYCSQTAWLLNGTIRENILFAAKFDENRYQQTVEACGLKRDFEILAGGDKTEIGEKGITLSGGQKQRISLARALYSNAAYVLLDDCLSAVDSHTAVHIYENCITGPLMLNRTCILVSHNVSLTIKDADYVVVMDNGRIKAQGDVDTLLNKKIFDDDTIAAVTVSRSASTATLTKLTHDVTQSASNHANVLSTTPAQLAADPNADQLDSSPVDAEGVIDSSGKLIEDETKSEGSVSWEVYKIYLKLFGGIPLYFAIGAAFVMYQGINIYQSYWLRLWAMKESEDAGTAFSTMAETVSSDMQLRASINYEAVYSYVANLVKNIEWNKPILRTSFNNFNVAELSTAHSTMYYLVIYSIIGVIFALAGCARVFLVYFGGVNVSRKIFRQLLFKILRAESRFFDSTPIGRIMNRFSKDIEGIDQELAPYAEALVVTLIGCVSTILLITWITPLFLIFGVFVSALFLNVGRLYLKLSRELKRFESITRSPINQHFTETLTGVTTIRAYGDEKRFISQNLQKIDQNNRPFFFVWVNNRWMAFRADLIGSLVVAMSCALSVMSARYIDAGLAGISLSFSTTFAMNAVWLLRCYANVEININSVERVQEYIDEVKQESAVETEYDPHFSWPSKGEIDVKNLSLKYAPHLPLVIKDISFHISPGEKVGVVGRTGAGKSTIITSFFRFIEPASGSIIIDGVDIGKIGLDSLRRGLAIIPQEPTLFTGTLRSNLDMFDEYKDVDIYESLRRVGLVSMDEFNSSKTILESGQTVDVLMKKSSSSSSTNPSSGVTEVDEENVNKFIDLESEVTENGGNLSQGERQLVCLARSLLKRPKILLLDEATASIDYETDAKIQTTIREEFSESTILTIAHRLKTIIDYDKILVLDHGKVKEYDHPYTLITKTGTQFQSMCQDTGEFDDLVRLAKEAYQKKH